MNAYRKNVGIVVYDRSGNVLLFERTDHPSSWQFPQGGIDPDEEPLDAAYRELYEETGITQSCVEAHIAYPGLLTYDFPPDLASFGNYTGQIQQWYYFLVDPQTLRIDLHVQSHAEFRDFAWRSFQASVDGIVAFKRPVYEALYAYFKQVSR